MTAPIVRFAPSPTGRIHIGNARTALYNWLFAKARGGRFILRFDDTDLARSTREFADIIETDLRWLGIEPDLLVRQSERFALYDAAMQRLRDQGRLYACYETQEELDRKRKLQLTRGMPPVYDRAGLSLTDEDRAKLEAQSRKPHWRFLLEREVVEWDDLSRGASRIDCASLSDPVLVREALLREKYRGGQAYYVVPRLSDLPDIEQFLREKVPEIKFVVGHGQMSPTQLEDVTDLDATRQRQGSTALGAQITFANFRDLNGAVSTEIPAGHEVVHVLSREVRT